MRLPFSKSMVSLSGSSHVRTSESRLKVSISHQGTHVASNTIRVTVMPSSFGLAMAMSSVTQVAWLLTATTSSQRVRVYSPL